jgi:hypothetical protein
MAKPNIAEKTTNTVLELTGKFTLGFIKAITGKSSASKQKVSFDGKAKVAKGGKDTANKIKPLKQGNEMIDMLMKIYNFMNKNFEEDKLHREKLANFKEEQLQEDERRHKALLKAIEDLKKNLDGGQTAVKSSGGLGILDIIDSILGAFGGLKNLISVGSWFLTGLTNPFVLVALGGLAASAFATAVAADPNFQKAFDEKNDPYGLLSAMSGDAGSASQILANAAQTPEEKLSRDKKNAVLNKLMEDAPWYTRLYGYNQREYLKKKGLKEDQINSLIGPEKKAEPEEEPSTPAPSTPSTPAAAATPADTTPPTAKLNAVQSENNTAKVNNLVTPSTSTINNVKATTNEKTKPQDRMKMLSVRNQEETFQRMITYSTRVV